MHTSFIFQPLKTSYPISAEHLSKDITFLLEFSGSDSRAKMTLKLVNALQRNGFSTMEDVVNATAKRIQLIKRVGDKSFDLLLELLETVSDSKT